MNRPNFFIVGAPKCGTTSMHEYLSQHPDTWMLGSKEPIFFCKDFVKQGVELHGKHIYGVKSESDYLKLFEKVGNQKIIGESTIWYLYSDVAANEIKKFNKDAKILIMVRDPIELIYSLHSQQVYMGDENIESFRQALTLEESRKYGRNIPKTAMFPYILYYREIGRLSKHIKKWLKIFPKNQIKIILFDDLKNRPLETYKEVLDFLELDNKKIPKFEIVNSNKVIRNKFLLKIDKNELIRLIGRKMIPYDLRIKIIKSFRRFNTKYQKREVLPQDLRVSLKNFYKKEVESLSEILRRDLVKEWAYE